MRFFHENICDVQFVANILVSLKSLQLKDTDFQMNSTREQAKSFDLIVHAKLISLDGTSA